MKHNGTTTTCTPFAGIMAALFVLAAVGCNTFQNQSGGNNLSNTNSDQIVSYRYIPIEPLPMPAKAVPGTHGSDDAITNEEILKSLHNEAFMMYLSDSDFSGSASMVASLQGGHQNGVYTLDQIKYRVCPYTVEIGENDTQIVFLIVGIGGRATIKYSSNKVIANSGGIFGLAAQLSASKAQGSIDIRSMGITGKSIAPFMGSPGNITMNNITDSLKKIDAIKLVGIMSAGDADLTILHPQIIAVDPQGLDMKVVMSSLYRAIDKAIKENRQRAAKISEAPSRSSDPGRTTLPPETEDTRPDVDVETLDYMLY